MTRTKTKTSRPTNRCAKKYSLSERERLQIIAATSENPAGQIPKRRLTQTAAERRRFVRLHGSDGL